MALEIVGAGFLRTGTASLHTALEMLGYAKCYHMIELFAHPEHIRHWENARLDKDVDWGALFEGYKSSVDFPGSMHFDKLLKQYPDAKVILTVRDPEEWYQSVSSTAYSFDPGPALKFRLLATLPFSQKSRNLFRVTKLIKSFWTWFFEGQFEDKQYAIKKFNEHIEHVKKITTSDNLMIFDVRSGWEPLCQFLGVEEPKTPFPHANKRENFMSFVRGKFWATLKA